jgi:hypothetical protein
MMIICIVICVSYAWWILCVTCNDICIICDQLYVVITYVMNLSVLKLYVIDYLDDQMYWLYVLIICMMIICIDYMWWLYLNLWVVPPSKSVTSSAYSHSPNRLPIYHNRGLGVGVRLGVGSCGVGLLSSDYSHGVQSKCITYHNKVKIKELKLKG